MGRDSKDINTGFIALHRSIIQHWIWDDPVKLKWWLDIIMTVNHTETKVLIGFELMQCGRGQCLYSLQTWAKRWRVDVSTVRRFFSLLQKDGMIRTENVKKTTRLTVCNYDSYNNNKQSKQSQNNGKATPEQFTDNTIKEGVNNDKNEKQKARVVDLPVNEKIINPFKDEAFTDLWNTWKEYRSTEHRYKFKTTKTEQTSINHLFDLSNGSLQKATEIVNNSIANGWKGLFPIGEKKTGTGGVHKKTSDITAGVDYNSFL